MADSQGDHFTVGVEEEYQLVSASTLELRSRARDVLATDWTEEIHEELYTTMLEVGTHVCSSAAEVNTELRRLRLQVASAAAAEDLHIVAAGLHPFSRWHGHQPSPGDRYARIMERYARVIRTEHVFGMHVHVGLPPGVDRLQVQNCVRWFTPHLIALTGSSPVYEGEDTGFSSYRSMLWRRLPNTGPPPEVPDEASYRRLIEQLVQSGAAQDWGSIYWTIRPHRDYPTLEFRAADVCPRVDDAVAVAALMRAVVAAAVEGALERPSSGISSAADTAVLAANDWTAARYGLDAVLAWPGAASGGEPVRDSIRRLRDGVAPIAEQLGDAEALAGLDVILERGSGADRIRERFAADADVSGLVRWLANESVLGTGLDRRMEQREGELNGSAAG